MNPTSAACSINALVRIPIQYCIQICFKAPFSKRGCARTTPGKSQRIWTMQSEAVTKLQVSVLQRWCILYVFFSLVGVQTPTPVVHTQEEIVAVKKALQTDLRVTKGGGKVILDLRVAAPAAACQYDVEALDVRVTLGKGAADDTLSVAERVQHVDFELPNSSELPGKLRAAISRELEQRWRREALQAGQCCRTRGVILLAIAPVKCSSMYVHP